MAINVGTESSDSSSEIYERSKSPVRLKDYNVAITYAAKIPIKAIVNALSGKQSEHFQEAMRVLDIILRQHAAKQGCLLVRQSFFHSGPRNFVNLGGGVFGCRGFHSSFRATNGGLSLNMDVSTTMIVQPGPVVDFLLANQNVNRHSQIDWIKAKGTLKNLRIIASSSNLEFKIIGLSDKICEEQTFSMKQRNTDELLELTVYEYFVEHRKIPLNYSANLPCLCVGRPKHPTLLPIELCTLVSLQRYTKALTSPQRTSLVENSRISPQVRMRVLTNELNRSDYNADPLLVSSRISINNKFTRVEGRVLAAPKLTAGESHEFLPINGRWNFNGKTFLRPKNIESWIIVNFSAEDIVFEVLKMLMECAKSKGISLSHPRNTYYEKTLNRRNAAPLRVEEMFKSIVNETLHSLQFILCILPQRKNCDLYGPWKKKNLSDLGIVTQCIAPTKINFQYMTNVLMKINAKMGGINSLLLNEHNGSNRFCKVPTIIFGMDVSHGSPGQDVPSIAAVVSSREWPLFSRYRAVVRTQSPKTEMIAALYQKVAGTTDEGIFRELLSDFYDSCGHKPEQIIIFRDGVSESQFTQVLNIELEQMFEACKFLDETWSPKFLVIIAQKNHHTRFFDVNSMMNVPPGTVIDNGVCDPRNNDFFMCAHAGMIGTTRPTHYHVLHDEIGLSADEVQELVHSLSYVYQRSTTAVSLVAPVYYAHHAAAQASKLVNFDEVSELPKLHENLTNSMFFC